MRSLNKKIYKVIIILSFLFSVSNIYANAGEEYKLEVDRSADTKAAYFNIIPNKECKLTKSLKSEISSCLFINIYSESSSYPSISFGTISDEEDLLPYSGSKTSNAIVTFDDDTIKKRAILVEYEGDSMYGVVLEWVHLNLYDLKEDLANISKLEFQFGSSKYEWIPDKDLLQKALNFEE